MVFAVFALLLGLIAPVHAGPPQAAPPSVVQPTAPDVQPAVVIRVYLIANRALGPPSGVLFFVVLRGHPHSAAVNLYAYCGGDPVNRMDPSGLDWVEYEGDDVYYYHEQDSWAPWSVSSGRTKIGTRGAGDLINLEAAFQNGGRTMVEFGSLNEHAAGFFSGDTGNAQIMAGLTIRRAMRGELPFNAWATIGDDINAGLARGSNGAQRVVQGAATTIGSIALAVPTLGATSLTASVGVDQGWVGMQDIWNADDPNAVPVSTHLANLIGEKPATYVEIASGIVTSPGLGPKPTPPNLRVAPGPFSLWSMSDDARGLAIEAKLLGRPANLSSLASKSFPVIDDFMNGVGTSIKSMDLTRSTYATGRGFFNALNRYTHSLSVFRGGTSNGFTVRAADMTERVLRVAVEPGRITPFIQSQIDEFMVFARENYPNVKILIETIK